MKRYLFSLAVATCGAIPFAHADEPKPKPAPAEAARKPGAGEKPAAPRKASRTSGRVGKVDAANKSFTLVRKGDGGLREDTFTLAPDAVVLIDGTPGKFEAVKAEMTVEIAMPGEGKGVSELRATGAKLNGIVKATTADSMTFGTKEDRTVQLAPGAKVLIQGKEGKLTDLKTGSRVFVLMSADESAAMMVTDGGPEGAVKPGVKKPEGDKPGVKKPEGDKPGVKKPEGDKPGVKKPEGEKPGVKKPEGDKPGVKKPEGEKP